MFITNVFIKANGSASPLSTPVHSDGSGLTPHPPAPAVRPFSASGLVHHM